MSFKQTSVELTLNGVTIRGTHHQGDTESVLVMLHGFTGNRVETNRLFYTLSKTLEEANIASIRFDFTGHGESDLGFEDLDMPHLFQETEAVITYALKHYKHVHLLGFSMGGVIALNANLENIRSLILIAPALNIEPIVKMLLETEQKLDAHSVDLQGYCLHQHFLDSLSGYTLSEVPKDIHLPVLLIHSEDDQAVPFSISKALSETLENTEILFLTQGGHVFHDTRLRQTILERIQTFIQKRK